MLDLKKKEYNDNKRNLSLTDLAKYFHETLRNDENYYWLKRAKY